MKRLLFFCLATICMTGPWSTLAHSNGLLSSENALQTAVPRLICPPGTFLKEALPRDVPSDLVARAASDQCFARTFSAPVTESYEEDVIVTPEKTEQKRIPAVTGKAVKRILLTPARTETKVIPASTHIEYDEVVVKPAYEREERTPAVYGYELQREMIAPHRSELKTQDETEASAPVSIPTQFGKIQISSSGGRLVYTDNAPNNTGSSNPATKTHDFDPNPGGNPDQYEERNVRVLIYPETVKRVIVPPIVERRPRVVVDIPARDVVTDIAAVYRDEEQEVTLVPERIDLVTIPAVVKKISKVRTVTPSQPVWSLVPGTLDTSHTESKSAINSPESSSDPKSAPPQDITPFEEPVVVAQQLPLPPRTDINLHDEKTSYRLGSGDKIRVLLYGDTEITGQYTVSGDGFVSIPLVGDMKAAGLSIHELQDNIASALKPKYFNDPRVSIEVVEFRPFYIIGEVNKPGEYAFRSGTTIMKAIAIASGYTYRANTKKYYLLQDGEKAELTVSTASNAAIQPGDTIRIAERHF